MGDGNFVSVCTRPPSRGLCAPDFPGTDLVIATYLAKHLWTPPPKRKLTAGKVDGASPALRASVFMYSTSHGERLNGTRVFSGDAQNACWGGWEVYTAEVTLVPPAQHAAPPGDSEVTFEWQRKLGRARA